MSDGILNLWDKIKIVCPNHNNPKEFTLISNTEKFKTPFYACDCEENTCANRVSLDDYQGIMLKFNEIVAKDEDFTDFTNFFFFYKKARHKIKCKILKYEDDEIIMSLYNETVLGK